MTTIVNTLRYTPTHEWARMDDEGNVTIGITDYAQHLLGDIVFIELPQLKAKMSAGKEAAVVESVKAAADVYAPINGDIIAVNHELAENPDLVNKDPYESGWLFRIHPNNSKDYHNLMDANRYQDHISNDDN